MKASSVPPSPSGRPAVWDEKEGDDALTGRAYLIGLLVVFLTSYSQYLFPGLGLAAGAFWVYGISVFVIGPIYGKPILRNAFRHTADAFKLGLGFFGIFTILGTGVSLFIASVLLRLDPAALNVLQKPVPVLNVKPELAWIMVGVSLAVVGPCEEFIFRGFVFGGLLKLFGTRHWLILVLLSSVLFAAVHLYYALTYGIASLMAFVDIVAIGMALAITYFRSGGNLLVPALIHGAYDATGFIAVATNSYAGLQLRGLLILAGVIVAVKMIFDRKRRGWMV